MGVQHVDDGAQPMCCLRSAWQVALGLLLEISEPCQLDMQDAAS